MPRGVVSDFRETTLLSMAGAILRIMEGGNADFPGAILRISARRCRGFCWGYIALTRGSIMDTRGSITDLKANITDSTVNITDF